MGAPNLLADNMEYGLSYSVVSYLKKLSQQVRFWAVVTLAEKCVLGVVLQYLDYFQHCFLAQEIHL